jgi:hypothetical protein
MNLIPAHLSFKDDQLIAEALASVDIQPTAWPECMSLWKCPVLNDPPRYAIVHPRFYGRNKAAIAEKFVGTWHAVIERGAVSLVLRLSNSEGEAQGVIVRQNSQRSCFSIDTIEEENSTIVLLVREIEWQYRGQIDEVGGEIDGLLTESRNGAPWKMRELRFVRLAA